jgi:D-amino-acid oxidase
MRKRCNDFVPGLADAEYDETPFVQGLRPFTDDNVRVEREPRWKRDGTASRVIHTYGQGGAGFSLSFGCAADVLNILKGLEAEVADSAVVKSHL